MCNVSMVILNVAVDVVYVYQHPDNVWGLLMYVVFLEGLQPTAYISYIRHRCML